MYNAERMNMIQNSRDGYEKTGSNIEQAFLGSLQSSKYKEEAYKILHKNEIQNSDNPEKQFENLLKLKEAAQKSFQDTLELAEKKNYINFENSMKLVEKCQVGNPEKPSHLFSAALYKYIKSRFDDEYTLKFFTAVGGSHLDVVHGIDFYFKLYLNDEEIAYATADITGRKTKESTKANVLINIDPEDMDKYDNSEVNKNNFDQEFFNSKIAEFGEEISQALLQSYINKQSK